MLLLKKILKDKGITGKKMAVDLGMSENNASRIIRGDQYPRFEMLAKIADYLNVDVRDLFKPTKEDQTTIYIKNENGAFIPFGKINKGI
ncbi:helix-turn-helix domain-containing protein [Flavobacteriales bacterium]|nr:helix-turn-helix domain-containing protein [Flavobacteriales bacterium]